MSSLSEEEIKELLRNRIRRQPRNFEQRRLLDVQNPCEFRQNFRLPMEAFEHLLEAVGPQLEHTTRRNRALTVTISFPSLPWYELILSHNAFVPWNFDFNGLECHRCVTPAILSLR